MRVLAIFLVAFAACAPVDRSPAGEAGPLPPRPPGALRVMSFNVRFANPADGPDRWEARRDAVAAIIRAQAPDLVGVQEPLRPQVDDLAERLPEYAWLGAGRSDGRDAGEFTPIFYRTDRLRLLDGGTFWLSRRPAVAGSRHWDAPYPRIATWAQFEDRRTGDTFVHLNAHFDHVGPWARRRAAHLVVDSLLAKSERRAAVVVTGDLNASPTSAALRILTENDRLRLRDAFAEAAVRYGPAGTFTGFGPPPEAAPRIDYVLVGPRVRVLALSTVSERPSGPERAPSDHRPIVADLALSSAPSEAGSAR